MGFNWKRLAVGIGSNGMSELPGPNLGRNLWQGWDGSSEDKLDFNKGGADWAINELRQGGYDPNEANTYYEQANIPIEQQSSAASKGAAAQYARRGLGNSGMATGAQSDVALKTAAQQRLAKLGSTLQATQLKRQRALDAYGVQSDWMRMYIGMQEAQAAMNQARNSQLLGGLGSIAQFGSAYYGGGKG